MDSNNYALFQITVKAIIKKDDEIFLFVSPDGSYDFPGGRMDESEAKLPLDNVLKREVEEECGNGLKFDVVRPTFITKRNYTSNGQEHQVMAMYFEAQYLGGDVALSDEHTSYEWVNPSELIKHPDKFVSEDEYEQFKQYFKA